MPEDDDSVLAGLFEELEADAAPPPVPAVVVVAQEPVVEAAEAMDVADLFTSSAPAVVSVVEPDEPTPAVVFQATPAATVVEEAEVDLDAVDFGALPVAPPPPPRPAPAPEEAEDESNAFSMDSIVLEREVPDIQKPWMKHHKFTLVSTIQKVREIVDAALAHGRCALDTETEGLDSRITYDGLGNPRTIHQIVGYCLCVDGVEGFYLPVRHDTNDGGKNLNLPLAETNAEIARLCRAAQPAPAPGALDKDPLSFREWVSKPPVTIYFWNAKFDQEMLYPVTGIDWWHPESFEDGMLACFCDYSADKALSLKHKAPENLRDIEGNAHVMIDLKELFIKGRPIKFNTLSPDEPGVLKYTGSDAISTYLMCEPPRKHEKERKDYLKLAREKYAFTYRLEKQCIQAVRGTERQRVRIDREGVWELLAEHKKEFDRLLKEIQSFAHAKGFNLDPSSTQSLSNFLFEAGEGCLNISPKPERNEASGQYKTDGETLEAMVEENPHAPPVLKWIVAYRGEEKMLGTYLEHLHKNPDKNSELRFGFKECGAGTGRFSAPAGDPDHGFSGIPIHGIPNESVMRKLFIARDGYTFVKADYAAQELRIATNVSGEPVWVKEFTEGDGDLHSITARAFFNKENISKDERKMGKIANFALIYGGGPAAIIRATGCDKVEASRRKQSFDKAVPTFAGWIKTQQKSVKKDHGVWTAFKRWLAIPDATIDTGSPEQNRKIQAACERYAVNYPIQGSGADIMKISMVTLHKEFHKRKWLKIGGDDSVRMLLTVHDEVVFEVKHERVADAVPVIVEIMERPGNLATPRWRIPLVVEPLVGPNWGTGYKCERYVDYLKKCERMKKEPKLGEGEILVNGFIYGKIREVDLGKEKPGVGEVEHHVDKEKKKTYIEILDPAWLRNVSASQVAPVRAPAQVQAPTDDAAGPAQAQEASEVLVESAPATAAPPPAPPPVAVAPAPKPEPVRIGRIVEIRIHRLTETTVNQVGHAILDAVDPTGPVLKLADAVGTALIDPSLRIRVDPRKLADILDHKYNISNGHFDYVES